MALHRPLLALLPLLALGCAASRTAAPAAPAAAAEPATAVVSIPVQGMHCGCCVGRVTRALEAVDGVVSAETRLAEARAIVAYAPGRASPAALAAAIRAEGFEPGEPAPQ